jgi:hypothetical protein
MASRRIAAFSLSPENRKDGLVVASDEECAGTKLVLLVVNPLDVRYPFVHAGVSDAFQHPDSPFMQVSNLFSRLFLKSSMISSGFIF